MDRLPPSANPRRLAGPSLASLLVLTLVVACTTNAAPALSTPAPGEPGPVATGNTTGGMPSSVKDPCVLLTAADAKVLLVMDYEPPANKTDSPFLSCAYSTNSGSEALILAVSTNSLSIAKIGVDGAQDLSGLGDAAFVAGGGRNAVVAWTSGGVTYKLSWNTLTTATRSATTDPVIALAHTVAARI
jgi:hypothetical protein